jgi:hypothetical protein
MMLRRATTAILALALLAVAAVLAYAGTRPSLWHEAEGASTSPWSTLGTRASSPPLYPLRVGSTTRYLVDRQGRPFLIVGDAPQALIVNASLRDAETFFANRAARGFNSVWVNLLCRPYTGGRPDGTTYDGIAPFTTPGNLSTPNEDYFRRADAIIRMAGRYGITVFLDPIETGGWLDVLRQNGVRKDFEYGRWIGERYRSFPNIVWFNGNDFQDWRVKANDAVALAVARGIRATDRHHIQTVELDAPTSGSRDDASWTPIIGLDAAYTYYPTYAQVLKEYTRPDFVPTFLVEANYEFEDARPKTLRRQEYWSLLSGAAGQLYGSRYTWRFLPMRLVSNKYGWRATRGWRNTLDSTGVAELEYVTKLFAPRAWFRLVPDQRHRLVTSGVGTFATRGHVDDSDYATAARTPDGKLGIVYLPTRRTITVDLRRLRPSVDAKWYDPTTGRFVAIGGSPFPNTGKRNFTPPATNASGDDDWVLVLTAG